MFQHCKHCKKVWNVLRYTFSYGYFKIKVFLNIIKDNIKVTNQESTKTMLLPIWILWGCPLGWPKEFWHRKYFCQNPHPAMNFHCHNPHPGMSLHCQNPHLPWAFTVRIPILAWAFTVRIPTLTWTFTIRIPLPKDLYFFYHF